MDSPEGETLSAYIFNGLEALWKVLVRGVFMFRENKESTSFVLPIVFLTGKQWKQFVLFVVVLAFFHMYIHVYLSL